MSCEKIASRMLGYIDGRLKESERVEVEKHLASCSPCALRVEEFRAVSGLLDELPVIEPSPEFDTRVHALVAAEPVKKDWWAWLRVPPRIALVASALLVAALWLGFYGPGQKQNLPWNGNTQVADEQMMQDLPVLEDHDVLANFEPLKELPPPAQNPTDDDEDNSQQQM
ncbi:MAG TPA: zf-HC2 domain-containing protein [Dongiaceae bacterium]|nr:zf-HC2 domain-containing protein [Dongiaceae bacterium]